MSETGETLTAQMDAAQTMTGITGEDQAQACAC